MIDKFLTKHNITQYRLAKLLNVTQTTIARWRENGPANPTIMELALKELERRLK
jgi:transcriptional regulator with XRE-family HTH domain